MIRGREFKGVKPALKNVKKCPRADLDFPCQLDICDRVCASGRLKDFFLLQWMCGLHPWKVIQISTLEIL